MNILFVHQNFPGQFKHLIPFYQALGHQVRGIKQVSLHTGEQTLCTTQEYKPSRGNTPGIHPLVQEFETKIIRAEASANAAQELKKSGFTPDVIFAHPGWGEALLLKSVFPNAKLICHMEYFYQAQGQDLNFDPEFPETTFGDQARLLSKNANLLLAMEAMDHGVSPTAWQASTLPQWAQLKTSIIHEGINTQICCPKPSAKITLPDRQVSIHPGDEVLTFVARNLEPVRGYHIFMRALPEIMARRPNLKVFIVGGHDVSYGRRPSDGSYYQRYLTEVGSRLDPKRIFFLGKVSYDAFLHLMQITRCHVYLTYPFVLSWSMLEAMSAGAVVVGSSTPPVLDVIEDGRTGLLVDFFDVAGLAERVCEVLAKPEQFEAIRTQARQSIIERFDLNKVCLPAYQELLERAVSTQ